MSIVITPCSLIDIHLWNFNKFTKVCVLVTLCLTPTNTNMLQMMRRWLQVWNTLFMWKGAHGNLQKNHMDQKLEKGRQEWEKAYGEKGL